MQRPRDNTLVARAAVDLVFVFVRNGTCVEILGRTTRRSGTAFVVLLYHSSCYKRQQRALIRTWYVLLVTVVALAGLTCCVVYIAFRDISNRLSRDHGERSYVSYIDYTYMYLY